MGPTEQAIHVYCNIYPGTCDGRSTSVLAPSGSITSFSILLSLGQKSGIRFYMFVSLKALNIIIWRKFRELVNHVAVLLLRLQGGTVIPPLH